jgi:hypothetical protein
MDLMSILKQAGFKGQALQIAYAVAMAESSGNARAHNGNAATGDNSYGLFQINMLGSMGPERRKQFGLSSNEELFDPLTNAKIAYKMSGGGKNWTPWSTYTRGTYREFLGQNGATVTNSDPSEDNASTLFDGVGTTEKLSSSEMAEQYGFVESLLNSDKELKALFDKAVKGSWTPDKFQAELRDTNWWKKLNKTQREFLVTQYGDPATARQKLDQNFVKLKQLGAQMGVRLTDKGWKDLAYQYTYNGWTDQQLRYQLGRRLNMPGTQRFGEAGEIQDKLSEYAYNMGIKVSDSWMDGASKDIVSGMATQQDFESKLREQAKATYSFWAKQIDAGQSVSDLASPYMQTMAQLLELPPGSVNLFDPSIKKALQNRDSSGKSAVKPLWQFETEVRNDPRWRKTNNAQNSLMQVAHQVLSDFGMRY